MKFAIVTRADENIRKYTFLTLPIINKYAKFCDADFIILDGDPPFWTRDSRPHYRCLKVFDLLEEYDRILLMDADILITKNCPNLFNIVPKDKIGSIFEDVGTRKHLRRTWMRNVQREWGDIKWRKNYTNAGVYLISKMHKDLFRPVNGKYWVKRGSADVHLGYQAHKFGFHFYELSYKFNHMSIFSEPWNFCADKFESYIIHYAGKLNRLEILEADYNYLFLNIPKALNFKLFIKLFNRNFYFWHFIKQIMKIIVDKRPNTSNKLIVLFTFIKNYINFLRYW